MLMMKAGGGVGNNNKLTRTSNLITITTFFHENLYVGRYFMAVMRDFTYKTLRCLHSCSTFAAPSVA